MGTEVRTINKKKKINGCRDSLYETVLLRKVVDAVSNGITKYEKKLQVTE